MVLRCRPKLVAIAARKRCCFRSVANVCLSSEAILVIFHDDPFLLEDSSVSQVASPPRGLSHLTAEFRTRRRTTRRSPSSFGRVVGRRRRGHASDRDCHPIRVGFFYCSSRGLPLF